MPALLVDNLRFEFQSTHVAEKYDEWDHYKSVWNAAGGRKAVDVVAFRLQSLPPVAWLVEAKDYRTISQPPEPSNLRGLAETVASKVRDTLAGLGDAAANATIAQERDHAQRAIAAGRVRVVLHLEPHAGHHSKLFPDRFQAGVLQKLKQLLRGVDPTPLVLDLASTRRAGVPWTVS